ncbi:hypothetical protein PHMEG_00029495 [Phytophthora megakarya]|uniref:Uncharacterized protein n=1 Tax=Phytophthora megakarya TaxID=4795 RepID=A0A225V2D9_9STRA|nr:hypothetical protein PHMEG_00029495 [Phytophthora megakarya]
MMTLEPKTKDQAWSTVLFDWNDCLVIEEQGHKGDQTGADKFGKHVYENPYQPHQCAMLALAVHLFSCPERSLGGKEQLFVGSDSKDHLGESSVVSSSH